MSKPDLPGKTGAKDRAIAEHVIVPRVTDLGGIKVRRALPAKETQMVGPFIFFDEFGPGEFLKGTGLDVRPHPHIGLSTVTYLFDGQIMHRDSLGLEQLIRPGELNLMKAGKAIVHSERTPPALRPDGASLYGIQTWMALPKHLEESNPEFVHHGASDLPTIEGEGKKNHRRFRLDVWKDRGGTIADRNILWRCNSQCRRGLATGHSLRRTRCLYFVGGYRDRRSQS